MTAHNYCSDFNKKNRSTFLDRVLFKKHGPESNGSRQVLQNSFSMPKISLFCQQFRSFSCSKFPKLKNCSMLRSSFGGLAVVCRLFRYFSLKERRPKRLPCIFYGIRVNNCTRDIFFVKMSRYKTDKWMSHSEWLFKRAGIFNSI